jgi:ElaB/YqjD/DUF883 family membrane-anchored ribosome-binding protein
METHFPFTDSNEAATRREQLQTDLKIVAQDIEELLKSAAGHLSEKAVADLKALLARSKVLCARLETQASVRLRQADRIVRQHPYQFIGVAFAVGALIGVLTNRR